MRGILSAPSENGMSQQYYLRYKDQIKGPFSLEKVRALHDAGKLNNGVEIGESQELFYPLESMQYLLDREAKAPPAAPAVSDASASPEAPPSIRKRPRGSRGGARSGAPPRSASDHDADDVPPPTPIAPQYKTAMILGGLALVLSLVAIFLSPWFSVHYEQRRRSNAELDMFNVQMENVFTREQQTVSYADASEAYRAFRKTIKETARQDPTQDVSLISNSAYALEIGYEQTMQFSWALIILLGLGSLCVLISAATTDGGRKAPSTAMVAMTGFLTIMTLVPLAGFRLMGVLEKHGQVGGVITTHLPYFLALIAAVLAVAGFVFLILGNGSLRQARAQARRSGRRV